MNAARNCTKSECKPNEMEMKSRNIFLKLIQIH